MRVDVGFRGYNGSHIAGPRGPLLTQLGHRPTALTSFSTSVPNCSDLSLRLAQLARGPVSGGQHGSVHPICLSAQRTDPDSAFRYFTGLQYLVATGGEFGVSATKQKRSALPFCRNTPAPPPGGWVTPATV